MPIKRDDYGKVTLVVFKGIWVQLCSMAGVESHRVQIEIDGQQRNVQAISPVTHRSYETFWVCATMLLGNADAMMLAQISRDNDTCSWFDGLEVL